MSHTVRALALAVAGLITTNVVLADDVPADAAPIATADVSLSCDAEHPTEARATAELLMKQEDYQRAGECYLAAGDYNLANKAFLKSARPAATATATEVVQQRDTARALLNQVKNAFRSNH